LRQALQKRDERLERGILRRGERDDHAALY
jgi:hypothetical protein